MHLGQGPRSALCSGRAERERVSSRKQGDRGYAPPGKFGKCIITSSSSSGMGTLVKKIKGMDQVAQK